MERKRKPIQVYALIVCIIAIITFIISISILVNAIIDRSAPLYSNMGYSKTDLSSFENFKMDKLKSVAKDQAYIPNDQELKQAYEDAKTEKINKVLHNTLTSLIVSIILLLGCIILFYTHWRMIKKYSKAEDAPEVSP